MKHRILLPILIILTVAMLTLGIAAAETVYLNDNGYGDGTSADTPMGSLTLALEKVKDGGTIVITDTYSLLGPILEPEHEGEITITGGTMLFDDAGGKSRYYLNGPTKFEKITLKKGDSNTSKTGMVVARFNPVTFGEKVSVSNLLLYVLGGYQYENGGAQVVNEGEYITDRDSKITIKSGTYEYVIGFCRGNSTTEYTGTSYITVDGGTVKNLYGASFNGSYSGSTEITVNGGTVSNLYTAGDHTRRLNGSAKVTVNGGSITNFVINNVMGHTDVHFLGGTVDSITKSVAENVAQFVTDGKADLVVSKNVNIGDFIELFDTAKNEDGTPASAAGNVAVAQYTVLDKVPAESTAYEAKVYVANEAQGNGYSPDSPVDIKTAYQMLNGIDGTVVLINEIDLSKENFYEPDHENKIVITSYDGERYFDGGINTGKSKRVFFSGNTTIENTKINFESTALYVCRFNDVTFGSGVETVGSGSLYALAGHQMPTEDVVNEEVGSTLTVKSGDFYCVLGYTRGANGTYTFKGTQTLNLLGGNIKRVYGGVVQANVSDNVVINIDGANISEFIQLGGDQSNHSNNAVVNIKSGYIKQLDMRNVLRTTVVNWTGGTVDEFVCNNCEYGGKVNEEQLALANGYKDATYTLNYAGVTPTEAALALFTTVNASVGTTVKLTIGSTTAYINGEAQMLDAAPINRNNRTMLPVRFLANAFGVENDGIKWDAATRTATLTNSEVTIVVTIDAPLMTVNGETVALDSPAIIESNRTYLPVRAIANALGVSNENIAWDASTNTATLKK